MEKEELVENNANLNAKNSHTIVIAIQGSEPDWGTGILVEYKEHFYILSASHVIKNIQIEKLMFGYNIAPLTEVSKESYNPYPPVKSNASPPINLSVERTIHSVDSEDDIVLLQLKPDERDFKKLIFFKINTNSFCTPPIGTEVSLFGFSVDTTKTFNSDDPRWKICIANSVNHESEIVTGGELFTDKYDVTRHFLIEYKLHKDVCDPKGMSGGGVWEIKDENSNSAIWTPPINLVGIQTSFFRKSQIAKATRAERILKLLESIEK